MCGMHMPVGRLLKHRKTACCFNNAGMRLIRRDVEVAIWYACMEFSLNRKDRGETIKGVELFKYLGRMLEQSYNEWPVFRQNIKRAQQVWGRLEVILRREGEDLFTSAAFYRAVV